MLFLDYVPELNALEYDIYHYITNHEQAVCRMKIRDLAECTHTSTASILRFCRKFECSGFTEFKIKLSLYRDSMSKLSITESDETQYIHFLERTREPLLNRKIEEAVDILLKTKLVIFIGSGSSESIARYGAIFFSNLATTALRIEDPSNYPIEFFPEEILAQSCIVALSITGETREVIHYLQRLNSKKCQIISITNSENSTISRLSHLNIPCYMTRETISKYGDENRTIELTSQLPALFLIEKIARRLRLKRELE